ncbi:hypothetical protein ASG31_10925 [Chryseobacterium sp. Leaf404]|uniref:hypothetical protein n=1 Tax=unclassified Chryseobacterium TaxID=2593645 RepID=UPI0006F4FB13|nr:MULTISPECIES: hypothetical protein [unclassified Chryseobacterium]KQT16880.1 hypothetical protein ASG31_10925 [Chryseobacterium sp. Leaf404]
MEKCFVIQPFDNGKFDSRFIDTFEPAINAAGYEAYRVDKDLGVKIPINDIETGISSSALCFAEITTDNPNVWYELGYAYACNKDVILICSDERIGKYPFDIQHKFIINYKTGSVSDYKRLQENITNKIIALKNKTNTVKKISNLPLKEKEGLRSHEVAIMFLVMENCITMDESISVNSLKNDMTRSGFTDAATSVGVRTLVNYDLLEMVKENDDFSGFEYYACKLTEDGEGWILSNQHLLQFKKSDDINNELGNDDLPF